MGDLLNFMVQEDGGIDRAAVYTDGEGEPVSGKFHFYSKPYNYIFFWCGGSIFKDVILFLCIYDN